MTGSIGEGYRVNGPFEKSVSNKGFCLTLCFLIFFFFFHRKHVINIYIFIIISENDMNHGLFYVAKLHTYVIRKMP